MNVLSSSPTVVERIASLTDTRDVEVLEASLLKALSETLTLYAAYLFHLDEKGQPEFSLAFNEGQFLREGSAHDWGKINARPGVVFFPIRSNERLTGHLALQRDTAFSAAEHELLASMLRIYENFLSILEDSQHDKLTGLLNRKTFDDHLEKALQIVRRSYDEEPHRRRVALDQKGEFWLAIIDIDHFKRINDQYGHLFGDEVLILISRILTSTLRKNDLIFRFGGEEFVTIVYVADRATAQASFERLRQTVENHHFPQIDQLTISIGATLIKDTAMPSQLVGHADQALYYAKNHGRNQVGFYETLVEEHEIPTETLSSEVTLF